MKRYYPLGKRGRTPMGRKVWYEVYDDDPGVAYLFIEENGRLIWAGAFHEECVKQLKRGDYDDLVELSPRGKAIAERLLQKV